jgi:isopentenyl diphosphate isomerase/L-lactate dehydrogenase-like FMN-dependent dehydrogenase
VGRELSRRAKAICNVADARRRAMRALPRVLFDNIDGGSDDETTMRDNMAAYSEVTLLPRAAAFPSESSLAKKVLGADLAMPVILDPCGGVRLVHPDGDRKVVRAAGRAGVPFVMSTGSSTPPEQLAEAAAGPLWFQLHFVGARSDAEDLVDRVQKSGFGALFVTVDSTGMGNRERLYKHRAAIPMQRSLRHAVHYAPQLVTRPRWTVGYLRDGAPVVFTSLRSTGTEEVTDARVRTAATPTGNEKGRLGVQWSDIEWIRRQWSGPLVVKGLLTADDALRAKDRGADGVVVSNHGGRQLDGVPATLRALPGIRAAVGPDMTVLIDGGIRRGIDVIKALALGADAALFGRPYLYGLAAAGEDGVDRILEIFRTDLTRALAYLGCTSIGEIDSSFVDASRLRVTG